jgi:hypothetical protein
MHFLAHCTNSCKPLKQIHKLFRPTRSTRQQWPPCKTKNYFIFFPAHRPLWRNTFMLFLSSSKLMSKQLHELEKYAIYFKLFYYWFSLHALAIYVCFIIQNQRIFHLYVVYVFDSLVISTTNRMTQTPFILTSYIRRNFHSHWKWSFCSSGFDVRFDN